MLSKTYEENTMKKILIALAILSTLSFSLVSCRNYDSDNGTYGYYNNRENDRNRSGEQVVDKTRDRIMNSYNNAKNNVKNAIGNAANDIGNAMGVR